jgi:hypothetical protein
VIDVSAKEVAPSFDVSYLERRMERIERQLRMLFDYLEAKKILDEKIRQMFSETKTNNEELIEWYISELKKKQITQ